MGSGRRGSQAAASRHRSEHRKADGQSRGRSRHHFPGANGALHRGAPSRLTECEARNPVNQSARDLRLSHFSVTRRLLQLALRLVHVFLTCQAALRRVGSS